MAYPKISLSVPVYGTESSLPDFLDSILEQYPLSGNFAGQGALPIEIFIVNDGSPGGDSLRKILKPYKKALKKRGACLELLEHSKNLGTLEARRTAVNAASGEYLAFADPDDELPSAALRILYDAAATSGADIVHGNAAVCGMEGEPDARVAAFAQRAQNVYNGVLTGGKILRKCIVEHAYNSFVWGKLFQTTLVQKAYGEIPFTYCTMAEDMLLYFFIALYADKYLGIPDTIYNYRINTGVTSRREITELAEWEKICSTASVFTIILSYLDEHPAVGSEIREAVRELGRMYYADNLKQLEVCVVPALQEEAKAMLDEWWGIYN